MTIRVVPEEADVAVGGTVDVAVAVDDITDLYGIDILMEFNPLAVAVVDRDPVLEGVQIELGTFLEPGFVILNLVNNELGRLRLAMTQLAPASAKSGSGNLIVVRLEGLAADLTSEITVLEVKLSSPAGELIAVEAIESARVDVVQTLTDPTNTPIPATPPGTPMPTNTPETEPTQDTQPTQAPGEPTPTATDRFLNIPPTFTPSLTPTITQTPTVTLTPTLTPTHTPTSTATREPSATAQKNQAATPTPEEVGEKPVETNLPQEDQEDAEGGINPWWLILPGAAIGVGIAVWIYLRRRPPKLEEF